MKNVPVFLLVLDGVGSLLLVLGVLGLNGIDFGYPGLRKAAPVFLGFGALLIVPFVVWVVQRAKAGT